MVGGRGGRRVIPASRGQAHRRRDRGRRGVMEAGAPRGLRRAGACLERWGVAPGLPVLQPASCALRIAAEPARRTERAPLEAPGPPRLERSHDAAARAARQAAAVEPDNRLVARARERRGAEAVRQAPPGHEDEARGHRAHPPEVTRQARDAIGRCAQDVPAVWEVPATTAHDRHARGRVWRARVTMDVPGASDHGSVTIHGAGGGRREPRGMRPVARYDQRSTDQVRLDRIHPGRRRGVSGAPVAVPLTRAGLAPPQRPERCRGRRSARVLRHRGL